jgi:PPP family 3-phenylpropionic acid transporter
METRIPRLAGLLALFYVALFGSLGVQLPFLPRWLEARGIEGLRMGLVAAMVPGMALIGPPLFGLAADAFGLRGWLLRGAALMSFLCFALIGGAAAAGRTPGVWRPCSRRSACSPCSGSSMVMMADVMTMEHARKTGRSYPRIRLWGSVGLSCRGLGGRSLDGPARAGDAAALIASGFFIAFLVTWVLPARAETPPSASLENARQLLGATDFRLFLAACLLSQLAHSSYDLCFSLHLRDLGADGSFTGAAWSLGVVTEIVLMAFAPRVFRSFSPTTAHRLRADGGRRFGGLVLPRSGRCRSFFQLQPLHAPFLRLGLDRGPGLCA